MTMKIFYVCLVVLFFTPIQMGGVVSVFAQDQAPGDEHQPPSADDIVSKMQAKLSLTQDQVAAITPIIEKYTSKREELRQSIEDGTADKDSVHSQMKQLGTDEKQELSEVLSADQLSQWQQMMSQGRHKYNSEGQGAGPSSEGPGNSGNSGGGFSGPGE